MAMNRHPEMVTMDMSLEQLMEEFARTHYQALPVVDEQKRLTGIVNIRSIDQLQLLADEVQARFISSTPSESPVDIVDRALIDARTQFDDVLIVDTAGRLSIDEEMMAEIALLHGALTPVETLFVVDAMTGQDAALTSKAFDEAIALANDIEYGLSASIITRDITMAMRYTDQIEAGVVKINQISTGLALQVPFGGVKHSSSNNFKEQGQTAIDFYTRVKSVYLDYSA